MAHSQEVDVELEQIGSPENVPSFIEEVKKDKRRLFRFGYCVYKAVDPRWGPIKDFLSELDAFANPLLTVAHEIEKVASADEY